EKEQPEEFGLGSGRRVRERLLWSLAGALIGGLVVSLTFWNSIRSARSEHPPSARLAVTLPATEALADYRAQHMLALSPDGSRLVYVGMRGGVRQLYLRPIAEWNALPIPGTEGAENPFFSPDGHWVAFFADDKLKKVSLEGGMPVTLCSSNSPVGGTWGADNTIIFSGFTYGLFRVPSDGGTPKKITTPDAARKERAHIWPQFLPGGKAVLLTIWTGGPLDDARIGIADLATGKVRYLFEGGADARNLRSGRILEARGGVVLAVPFDVRRMEVTGPPTTVLTGAMAGGINGEGQFDFSPGGTLAYLPGEVRINTRTLVWADRGGASVPVSET